MPEAPDLVVYVEHIERRIVGEPLAGIRLASPFVLRSVDPPPQAFGGRRAVAVRRIAKQIVLEFEAEHFAVIHLMISGRLHWKKPHAALPRRNALASFDFEAGSLTLTEASKKKRASLHLVRGAPALAAFDPGGLEVLGSERQAFARAVRSHPHTIKRTLTDQRVLAGIGNAYSDEILHRARLSPFKASRALNEAELDALYAASQAVLGEWIERLRGKTGDGFPEKVTAFHEEMAVHGKYREPCPVCGAPVQRIRFADNESNYCARCQTGGKVLADRSLSRLLKDGWPKNIEELEARSLGA